MFSIEVMVEEHENISRMLKVVRKVCFNIMNGAEIPYDDFEKIVDFVKNYADEHHHGKEEKILFDKMQEHLGALGNKLITHGMLVEHDFGRLYMHELREALARVKAGDEESKLDVIANAISYTHLLQRHIDKENNVIYPFGQKNLSEEVLNQVHDLTVSFEENAKAAGTQEKYISLLKKLEEKYVID